ncbi:hypothetical protein [Enterococcus phage vB_Efs8_KEN04]
MKEGLTDGKSNTSRELESFKPTENRKLFWV